MLRRCPPQDPYRGVAQPGSALAWGASGRWFKSSRPDHWRPLIFLEKFRGLAFRQFACFVGGANFCRTESSRSRSTGLVMYPWYRLVFTLAFACMSAVISTTGTPI